MYVVVLISMIVAKRWLINFSTRLEFIHVNYKLQQKLIAIIDTVNIRNWKIDVGAWKKETEN